MARKPKTDLNQDTVIRRLCAALCVLSHPSRGDQARMDRSIRVLEAEAVAEMAESIFSHELVRGVIGTGRPALFAAFIERHGAAFQDHVRQNSPGEFRPLLNELPAETLAAYHRLAPNQVFSVADLYVEAARRDDPALFAVASDGRSLVSPFDIPHGDMARQVIKTCGPKLAPVLEPRLVAAVKADTATMQGFRHALGRHDIKVIAALLLAGLDLSEARIQVDGISENPLKDFLASSVSAHGRIELKRRENLPDVLARKANEVFFGVKGSLR